MYGSCFEDCFFVPPLNHSVAWIFEGVPCPDYHSSLEERISLFRNLEAHGMEFIPCIGISSPWESHIMDMVPKKDFFVPHLNHSFAWIFESFPCPDYQSSPEEKMFRKKVFL